MDLKKNKRIIIMYKNIFSYFININKKYEEQLVEASRSKSTEHKDIQTSFDDTYFLSLCRAWNEYFSTQRPVPLREHRRVDAHAIQNGDVRVVEQRHVYQYFRMQFSV
jgi:hypothetical protein